MSVFDVTCPCSETMIKSYSVDEAKIRAKILIIKGNNEVYGVCKECNTEVKLPLQVVLPIGPPLILRK